MGEPDTARSRCPFCGPLIIRKTPAVAHERRLNPPALLAARALNQQWILVSGGAWIADQGGPGDELHDHDGIAEQLLDHDG